MTESDWQEFARIYVENERFRIALQWYATESKYRSSSIYMCGHSGKPMVVVDNGERARRALVGECSHDEKRGI